MATNIRMSSSHNSSVFLGDFVRVDDSATGRCGVLTAAARG
jgi:hypothetical protein